MKEIKPISTGTFGPVYNQFENKPIEAIRFLIEKKNGECIKVLHRDDIGDIDIVWGENNPVTNEGFGLKHIIEKHGHEFKNAGVDLAEHLSKIIEKGVKDEKRSNSDRIVLIFEFFRGAITLNWHKKSKRLLLTAYSLRDSDKTLALSGQFLGEEVQVLSSNQELVSDSGFNSLKSEKLIVEHKDTTNNPDSDTVNKKNNSEQLGAAEVLEQNTYTDYSNFQPTYKQLPSYDHFFGTAGTDFPYEKGGLNDTLVKITDVINKYNYQAAGIAKHLKADTLQQSAFNLWHFCTTNIAYKLDKPGFEQLRTPNRSWKYRFTGIDCDCYAIFCSCCLLQMGYKPKLAVVAFNNNSQFGHIYVCINSQLKGAPYNLGDHNGGAISGGIVCDPVLRTIFNKHPKGITKAKIMNIEVLNGLNGTSINGLGAVVPADATTQKLIDHQEKLMAIKKAGQKVANYNKEMRKLQFMILMNGHPDRNHYLEIMPLVDDIDKFGQFVFISEEAANEALKFLDATVGKGLTNFDLNFEDGKAVQIFKGLGSDQLEELGKLKDLFKKVKDKVKKAAGKVKDAVKAAVKNPLKAIVRYNPVSILMRNGMLAAFSLNFRNKAKQLYIGLMTPAELQTAGYTTAYQVKMKGVITKLENLFVKFGGIKENLFAAIKSGKSKKALFGSPKKGIRGLDGIEYLGEPVTMAAITAAMAPILAVVKWIKDTGITFKKEDEDTTSATEDTISPEQQAEFDKALLNPDASQLDDESDDNTDKKDNTLLYVGGGLGILGFLYVITRPKNKN